MAGNTAWLITSDDYVVRTARNRGLPSTTRWYAFGASANVAAAAEDHLKAAAEKLEYLTPLGNGRIPDKAKAGVPSFSPEKLIEVGLTPQTWSLEVVADTASGSVIEQPLTRATNNALDWNGLMRLSKSSRSGFAIPASARMLTILST